MMSTPSSATVHRQPLQAIGNRNLPAKQLQQHSSKKSSSNSSSSSPANSHVKLASSMLSSSPPRSSSRRSSFAFTSSPGGPGTLSSIASSPPPSTPLDSPHHLRHPLGLSLFNKDVLSVSAAVPRIEHVNLEASSQLITITIGQAVHIGRKLKKLEQKICSNDNFDDADADEECLKLVTIPKAAKHASRHHCSLKLHTTDADEMKLDIQVLGQNGMQLEGAKIPTGRKSITVTEGEAVLLGFYTDFDVKIICKRFKDSQARHVTADTASMRQEAQQAVEEHLPAVPTSEATLGLDLEMDLEEEDDGEEDLGDEDKAVPVIPPVYKRASSSIPLSSSVASSPASISHKKRQTSRESSYQPAAVKRARLSSEIRSSSPSSSSPAPSPYAHQDDDGYPPEDSSESEDEEAIERRKEAQLQEAYTRVKTAIKTLSLDLIGILASGIVFQPRATLTTSECIHLLLESQPSLQEYGKIEEWRPSVLEALRNGPFGVIENEGLKDASGKRLEPDWHYNPDLDNDNQERKLSLQPFVKSIRSTQRQKKQYFFKRPSDLKSRRW